MRTRKNNQWNKLLSAALKKMPNEFTSHDFNLACRQLGVSSPYLTKGGGGRFLAKFCYQKKQKTWQKERTDELQFFKKLEPKSLNQSKNFEAEAIEYLKDIGYEIYKVERRKL